MSKLRTKEEVERLRFDLATKWTMGSLKAHMNTAFVPNLINNVQAANEGQLRRLIYDEIERREKSKRDV